jgi:hypothetical protein
MRPILGGLVTLHQAVTVVKTEIQIVLAWPGNALRSAGPPGSPAREQSRHPTSLLQGQAALCGDQVDYAESLSDVQLLGGPSRAGKARLTVLSSAVDQITQDTGPYMRVARHLANLT